MSRNLIRLRDTRRLLNKEGVARASSVGSARHWKTSRIATSRKLAAANHDHSDNVRWALQRRTGETASSRREMLLLAVTPSAPSINQKTKPTNAVTRTCHLPSQESVSPTSSVGRSQHSCPSMILLVMAFPP